MPRRSVRLGLSVGLASLALLGGWRWWLAPRRAAAAEADSAALVELRARTSASLAASSGPLAFADAAIDRAALRWQAPGACVEVYRLRVDDHFRDASVATFLGRPEEHASYLLAVAADPSRPAGSERQPALGLLIEHGGDGSGESPRIRELWWSAREVGPSAPDFACRRRGWDPVEDALALAWPRLPEPRAGSVRVGERWRGAAVEGRCHETVCLDPDGSFGHAVPCRARPWSEQLAGADGSVALVFGRWDDGHDPARPEIGILTSRAAVLDQGRPLQVRAQIDQRWAGVRRELSLVRLDDCSDRSLAGPGDPTLVDETRARFRAAIRARLPRPAAP